MIKILFNTCVKKFHVSPFIEMNCTYFFRLLKPGKKISVIIDQMIQDGKFYMHLKMVTSELIMLNLLNHILKHPINDI